jgi:hypothetical protein
MHIGASTGAALAACLLLASAAIADGPKRYEPLRSDEVDMAVERALGARPSGETGPERSRAAALPANASRELLRVERRQRSKLDRRRGLGRSADVYQYDYERDLTIHTIVRLPSGEIESIDELPGVQLPLTEAEVARATLIALADRSVRDRIQGLFRQNTGEVLESLDQLHAKAMVFSAESMPDSLNDASRHCGLHRCAQLLLFTAEHVAVEVIPIVDLSTGALVQVLDF